MRIVSSENLDNRGGLALVRKTDVKNVVTSVDTTIQPTAIVTSESPFGLRLKGYTDHLHYRTIVVPAQAGGRQEREVQRKVI